MQVLHLPLLATIASLGITNSKNMENNTIFDLQQSRKDSEFVASNADLELEVGADIIETAAELPYVGSLLKLGKVAKSYIDYRFFRKLARFLKNANEIPEEKVSEFLDKLELKDKRRISDYLTQLLYTAEDEEKADIMGKIYVRRVYGEINNDMLLRLCSIVNRSFVADLSHLADYREVSENNDFVTDNLVALGVLADAGNVYEESDDEWEGTGFGPTKHALNEIGWTLLQILNGEPIEAKQVERIDEHAVMRPITASEIDEIIGHAE